MIGEEHNVTGSWKFRAADQGRATYATATK